MQNKRWRMVLLIRLLMNVHRKKAGSVEIILPVFVMLENGKRLAIDFDFWSVHYHYDIIVSRVDRK